MQTVQHLDKAIDLIQKYEVDGSGWDKYQLDGVYVRIVELRELFATWQIVIEMDEDGNDLPQSEIEARLAKAKSAPLVRLEMPNEKRLNNQNETDHRRTSKRLRRGDRRMPPLVTGYAGQRLAAGQAGRRGASSGGTSLGEGADVG